MKGVFGWVDVRCMGFEVWAGHTSNIHPCFHHESSWQWQRVNMQIADGGRFSSIVDERYRDDVDRDYIQCCWWWEIKPVWNRDKIHYHQRWCWWQTQPLNIVLYFDLWPEHMIILPACNSSISIICLVMDLLVWQWNVIALVQTYFNCKILRKLQFGFGNINPLRCLLYSF